MLSDTPDEYDWKGPSNINKETFNPYKDKTVLRYHVVTLTWRLTFPGIPCAHVTESRRAPRLDADAEVKKVTKVGDEYFQAEMRRKSLGQSRSEVLRNPHLRWLRQIANVREVSARQAEAKEASRRRGFEG